MSRRTWIKIYCDKWLRGTLREENPTIRGIWIDVLALAGDSAYGDNGMIKLGEDIGLTDEQIHKILGITLLQWQSTKQRLIKTERIKVLNNNIIQVVNWKKYQSEYERQKSYRPKLHSELTEIHSISISLSNLLLSLILKRKENFSKPNIDKWAEHIEDLITINKRTPEQIEKVIRWCQADDFWQNNILSTNKLRKQIDQLELKMKKDLDKCPKCKNTGRYVSSSGYSVLCECPIGKKIKAEQPKFSGTM